MPFDSRQAVDLDLDIKKYLTELATVSHSTVITAVFTRRIITHDDGLHVVHFCELSTDR